MVKASAYIAGDLGSIPGSGRSPGEGNGNPFSTLARKITWTEEPGPGGSDGKNSACNAGDLGLIPGLGKSPGEGNGYPLQYSGLENSMDRGAWQATVHGVAKRWTQLSNFHFNPLQSAGG